MTSDRVGRPRFSLSREFLAIMLGRGRRRCFKSRLCALEEAGAVAYVGSEVTVLDSGVLQVVACECYDVAKAAFADSLLR